MRGNKVIKMKVMNKNKQHNDLKLSSVKARTAYNQTVEKHLKVAG